MKSSFTLNEINFFASGEEKNTSNLSEWINKQFEDVSIYSFLSEEEGSFNASEVPCKKVLSNIFSYSRALSVLKTEKVGSFNFLLN